ncbi:hypothetical protein EB796_025045 [Bugula neritina]|uniref:Uncharacterized protein n=1 Tax=Bugula neritina TaxID=10212 RepID=A0A7J7IRR9_BUGNE|nr:hypothetical protein EB796_025045 [Bugula neritina]
MKLENKPAALPELNLYNFEEEEFADSKYVLTSPRSLEACDMLNVKPLELIYKPLSDYQDEMRRRGLTFQHAYDEYDKFEKSRQRKLRECRDYRDKMIRDNIFKNSPDPATEYDVMLPADDGLYEVEDSHRVTTSQSLFTTPYSSEGVFHTQPLPSSTWRASKANKVDDTHLQSNGREENGWRAHPPFSERHLSKHRHRTKSRHVDDLEPSHEVLASEQEGDDELTSSTPR